MSVSRLLFALSALLVVPRAANAADTTSHSTSQAETEHFQALDFAWGMTLTPTAGQALQTFVLPQSVLEHCDAARQQLAVFNASGDLVPHAVRELGGVTPAESLRVDVPFFPIRGTRDGSNPQTTTPPLQVQIRRLADGTLTSIAIETGAVEPSAGSVQPAPVTSYILDTSQIARSIERLHFDLIVDDITFVWPLTVATSNDLDRFTRTSARGTLATLRHAGHDVLRRDLTLDGMHADYLRLTWTDPVAPAAISRVTAELSQDAPKTPLDVRELEPVASLNQTNERVFDLGAALPVQALDLVLEKNSVIEAELAGSPDLTSDFVPLKASVFYHLEQAGELLHNERVEISRQRVRRIRVRVASKGGGLGSSPLRLQVHSMPEQLLFVARGNGPFQLAFGRAGKTPTAFDARELTSLIGASLATLPRTTTEAGPVVQLAGQAALVVPKQTEWKKIALWFVLIVAVGLLAALSVKLIRRVDSGS